MNRFFLFLDKYRYAVYFLLLLPMAIFRDFTPGNELKYISIVDEALRDGNWFTFYNHGFVYADKPPLFFWLIMLSRFITGGYHMGLVGMFSLLPAIGIMMVMDRWLRLAGRQMNMAFPALMLGTTIIFLGSAIVVRMDMLMTLFIVLAFYFFYKLYHGVGKKRDKYLLPVWIFLGVFTKGAMGVLMPVVTILVFLALNRKIRTFGQYLGWKQWGIMLGLCLLWFGSVYLEGGSEYLNNILFKQTVGRGINSFHHKEPFWYYIARMFHCFAPWIFLYLVSIWTGIREKLFGGPVEKFFITVIWVNFLMLSLVSSKLEIYMLPIYPFVAYLCAAVISQSRANKLQLAAVSIPAVIFSLVPVGLLFDFSSTGLTTDGALIAGTAVLCLGGILGLCFIYRQRVIETVMVLSVSLLVLVAIVSFDLQGLNRVSGYRIIAEEARQTASDNGITEFAFYRFFEYSNMDVYLGQQLRMLESVGELEEVARGPERYILFVRDKEIIRTPELARWLKGREVMGNAGRHSWYIIGHEYLEEITLMPDQKE